MGWAPVNRWAAPRAMLIIPRVTTKGVTLPLVITRPLSSPSRQPISKRGGDDQRHGPAAVFEAGTEDPGQGQDRAHRQIDPGREDHERHAHGHDAVDRGLPDDVQQVPGR